MNFNTTTASEQIFPLSNTGVTRSALLDPRTRLVRINRSANPQVCARQTIATHGAASTIFALRSLEAARESFAEKIVFASIALCSLVTLADSFGVLAKLAPNGDLFNAWVARLFS